jgi:hypothetical protein
VTDDCALLHVYCARHKYDYTHLHYNLHLDDNFLCHVWQETKTTIRITTPGDYTLWAKTEKREEIPISIQLGKEYYLRCGLKTGAFLRRPELLLVDPQMGKSEFDKLK